MKPVLKKNIGNLVFIVVIALLLIPQTRQPIQVFVQRLIASSPRELPDNRQPVLVDYSWHLYSLRESQPVDFTRSKGRFILINFWATWCPPCRAEMPSLQSLYNEYGKRLDFYFVTSEKEEPVNRFLEKHSYELPVYLELSTAPERLQTETLPTTLLLTPEGKVLYRKEGVADWNTAAFKKRLDELLNP